MYDTTVQRHSQIKQLSIRHGNVTISVAFFPSYFIMIPITVTKHNGRQANMSTMNGINSNPVTPLPALSHPNSIWLESHHIYKHYIIIIIKVSNTTSTVQLVSTTLPMTHFGIRNCTNIYFFVYEINKNKEHGYLEDLNINRHRYSTSKSFMLTKQNDPLLNNHMLTRHGFTSGLRQIL